MRLATMGLCERPGIPTSDIKVPSRDLRAKFTGEFEYRVDVFKVSDGPHIEHLYVLVYF
jgi:hypothetical protein